MANSNAEMNVSGGKVAPDFGNGQYHPNNNRWLRFDVHQDAVLHSVEVHSQNAGNATVEVLDNSGAMVASVSQPLSSGLNVLNLEIEICLIQPRHFPSLFPFQMKIKYLCRQNNASI